MLRFLPVASSLLNFVFPSDPNLSFFRLIGGMNLYPFHACYTSFTRICFDCFTLTTTINWRQVNQGSNVAPQEEVHWREVRWLGRPSHCPLFPHSVQSSWRCWWGLNVDSEEDLISLIADAAATWHFRTHTSFSAASLLAVYRGRWPCIWT